MSSARTSSGEARSDRPRSRDSWAALAMVAMPAGVLVVDDEGRIRIANPNACEILGKDRDALEGHTLEEVIDSIETLREGVALGRGRGSKKLETPRGTTTTIGYSIARIDFEVEGVTYRQHVILFQDITPIVSVQEERDRLLQLAAVGEALPSLLHEIRNPMASVSTALEVLIEETESEEQKMQLHALLAEVRRVTLTLQGIGTAGREIRSDRYAAIDHAMREACRILAVAASDAGVTVTAHVPDMPLLPLDPTVLRGLLYNLLNNAVSACRGGGRVDVTAKLEDGMLIVDVTDDGGGMSPEVLARCTELFFTTKPRGSGIGLALCRRTLEEDGGSLAIASSEGHGTRVTMRVPVVRPR